MSYKSRWNAQAERFDGAYREWQEALFRVRSVIRSRFSLSRINRVFDLRNFARRLPRAL
jgi:hypothetical protein